MQLAEAIRAAQLAKERGRELQERGARESDVFLLFSDKYALEGDSVDLGQGIASPPALIAIHCTILAVQSNPQ